MKKFTTFKGKTMRENSLSDSILTQEIDFQDLQPHYKNTLEG